MFLYLWGIKLKKINKLMIRNVFVLAFLLSTAAVNAQLPVSTDGTDPKTWDPKLDATISGENNHKIIYEDEYIRVLSVTVKPGEVEKAHHHSWPSVIV
jgi:quercetin dioxygenase-like cupin family protein